MPNWTYNSLEVGIADNSDVEEAKKQLKEFKERAYRNNTESDPTDLCFDNFLPTPPELFPPSERNFTKEEKQANIDKYGNEDWYDWRCRNWGCKWDASDIELTDDEDLLHYTFQTPWSPPEAFLLAVSKMYPLLNFNLYSEEEGKNWPTFTCDFCNGEILNNEIVDENVDDDDDDFFDDSDDDCEINCFDIDDDDSE